jgi:hypothetical protein
VDTYNDFKDDQGNQLQIGELNNASNKGKRVLSFADNVPARDIKLALSLVVRLLLEHSSVTNDKSCIHDSLMVEIKKSSKEELTHSNLFGRVNASFAKFIVDFLAMSLLFDSLLYHAPAPWAGRHLSMDEQCLFRQNQIVLIKFCLQQNEDVAWKLFGKSVESAMMATALPLGLDKRFVLSIIGIRLPWGRYSLPDSTCTFVPRIRIHILILMRYRIGRHSGLPSALFSWDSW